MRDDERYLLCFNIPIDHPDILLWWKALLAFEKEQKAATTESIKAKNKKAAIKQKTENKTKNLKPRTTRRKEKH